MIGRGRWIRKVFLACGLALGLCGSAAGADQITWPGSPTPVTLSRFEVARTPRGRLISWKAAGERRIKGYRVQARGPGKAWRNVSALIPAARAGAEEHAYAWHHKAPAKKLAYRLVEISRGGMTLPVDETRPGRGVTRSATRKAG